MVHRHVGQPQLRVPRMTGPIPAASDLDTILARTRHLLLDFDGPICSIFAGLPAATVADRLRKLFGDHTQMPDDIAQHPRPPRGIRLRGHRQRRPGRPRRDRDDRPGAGRSSYRRAHSLRPRSRDRLPELRPLRRRGQQQLSPRRPLLPRPARPGRPDQPRGRADTPRPRSPQAQPAPDHPGSRAPWTPSQANARSSATP